MLFLDINECARYNESCHICENMIGSYNCTCFPGFELLDENDLMFCQGVFN